MGIKKAIFDAVLKSANNSLTAKDRFKGKSLGRYISVQAHPDDEILKAGIDSRLIRQSENPQFVSLTDGNRNTEMDRVSELQAAFRILGYDGKINCLMKEREILDFLSTEQGSPPYVSDKNVKRVANKLRDKIDWIEEKIEYSRSDKVLTTDYAGGHFVHDITQMITAIAARRVARRRPIEMYEFPQYYLKLKTPSDIGQQKINDIVRKTIAAESATTKLKEEIEILTGKRIKGEMDLSDFVTYAVGEFVDGSEQKGLDDMGIGMYQGEIHLTFGEMLKKLRVKQAHKSQRSSLRRMLAKGTAFGDFSVERLRQADMYRDYSQRPNTNILLYEVVPWRPHADFTTFRRLYEEILSKESSSTPLYQPYSGKS